MLQDISYVCIGKGIRKCCSIDSVSDEQCINTEQFYHHVRLDQYDEYSDDSKTFMGTHAEYLKPKPWDAQPQNSTDEEDPDADIDPDNILEKQTFNEVSFIIIPTFLDNL
jgi:hypothetical protein